MQLGIKENGFALRAQAEDLGPLGSLLGPSVNTMKSAQLCSISVCDQECVVFSAAGLGMYLSAHQCLYL